jgi:RimJ/RimL family protein N-acetyltransferase
VRLPSTGLRPTGPLLAPPNPRDIGFVTHLRGYRPAAQRGTPCPVSVVLRTPRLVVRDWSEDDAAAALAIYGRAEVARWLSPAVPVITDQDAMRATLRTWIADTAASEAGVGHWAVTLVEPDGSADGSADGTAGGRLVGGVSLHPLPVEEQDVEIGWQIAPEFWGNGYATEAGRGLLERAFANDVDEVFALVRPANRRAEAAARRVGMTWVGETEKYYGLVLNVFRIRHSDLVAVERGAVEQGSDAGA